MTDIGADKSEQLAEPGIVIPFDFCLHPFINFPMRAFHNLDACNTKLRLANSVLIKGRVTSKFDVLIHNLNISETDMGILSFSNLKRSINVR